jgi:hypothetical protein
LPTLFVDFLFQAADKAIATNDCVVVIITVILPNILVNSMLKTCDKKATNGNRHAMLKVIQHGITIAKFQSDQSRQLQINQKIAAMEEGDY